MTDKKKLQEALGTFIDSVAAGDDEGQRDSMQSFIANKTKGILEFSNDSSIKLDGDNVVVSGKPVGTAKSDDLDSGINFTSGDGKFSKEFNKVEDLYKFVADKYNVKEGVLELTEDDLNEDKSDSDKAVSKQSAHKTSRLARWAAVRKAGNPDGTAGEYDAGDEKEYVDSEKGGPDAAYAGGEKDLETDATYDEADVRKNHNS